MIDVNPIWLLAGVTLVLALAFGIWQMKRTEEAKRKNEHSALTSDNSPGHDSGRIRSPQTPNQR